MDSRTYLSASSVICVASFVSALAGCHPTPGPDKSVAGAVLGAGWGAGAGAVIGNQTDNSGPGAAIGAGFGAVNGLITGIGFDIAEGNELEQQRDLDALKVQVAANHRHLLMLQRSLDDRTRRINSSSIVDEIYFDSGRASIRLGSASQLERIAEEIKRNPFVSMVELHGHSDDAGNLETNRELSEARARTVATFLSSHGISLDQIRIFAHGATAPVAGNASEPGRQLNRRVEIILKP